MYLPQQNKILSNINILLIIDNNQMQDFDVYFIRHAESRINSIQADFVNKLGGNYSWDLVKDNQQFLNGIKYNPDLIDCSITQVGIQQTKQAKQVTDYYKPDAVIVSPLYRAMQTCDILFGKKKIPIFVQPIISEGLRSTCDISKGIPEKMQRYPKWNFSQQLQHNPLWFIDHQRPQIKSIFYERINVNKTQNYNQLMLSVLKVMKETKIYESSTSLRQRAKQTKLMLQKYREKYNKIAVVAHYNTINFPVSTQFNEHDEPIDSPTVSNCQIYFTKLQDICKHN